MPGILAVGQGIDWSTGLIGGGISLLVGVLLWMFLPRGVVLTKSVMFTDPAGRPTPDTWELKNESALPVRLTSVKYGGADAYDSETERFLELELPWDGASGMALWINDHVLEVRRTDWELPWSKVVIPPGEGLIAHVGVNSHLIIKYRRAGRLGVLERRSLTVFGHV